MAVLVGVRVGVLVYVDVDGAAVKVAVGSGDVLESQYVQEASEP